MLAQGNWLIPTIAGVPFNDKPPLTAWLIAASMTICGSQAEWAVRLPSALAAVATALMLAGLASRWFGDRVGLITGLMHLTTYCTLQLARLAECDIQLVTAVTAAMSCFALATVDSPHGRSRSRWLPAAFYAAAGLAFMAKGPIGTAFIFSSCLLFLAVNQDLRSLRFFLDPMGLALAALCVVAYPLAAYAAYPPILDHWMLHNFGRFQGAMGGQKPMLYYVYTVPLVLLPWFPFAALAALRGWREGALVDPLWRFFGCWIAPGMVLLSASGFKSKHYVAPLLPPLVIAAAVGLVQYLQWRRRSGHAGQVWMAAAALAGSTAAIAAVLVLRPKGAEVISLLIGLLGLGSLGLLYLERQQRQTAQLAVTFGTAWVVIAVVFAAVLPQHDTYRDQAVLARRINARLPDGATLHLVELPENQITYYLQPKLQRIDQYPAFATWLRSSRRWPQQAAAATPGATAAHSGGENLYLLVPERLTTELAHCGQVRVLDRCDSMIRWMQPGDRLTLVQLVREPSTAASKGSKPIR
jgi:4-amino-4-deoxy-L-arabinose transferase-like glycosyltransferase